MTKKSLTPNQLFSILNKAAIEVQQLPPDTEIYFHYDESGAWSKFDHLKTSLKIVVSHNEKDKFAEVVISDVPSNGL
jgi:hypothetical protein